MIEVKYSETRQKWMLFNKGIFLTYTTEDMVSKANFINRVLNTATTLAQEFDQAPDTEGVYFDRGYNSGGANEITQSDLDSYGVVLANFTAMITCIQQLDNFAQNQAVYQADYSATVNKLRNDI